jgi:dienelactone hydrolase
MVDQVLLDLTSTKPDYTYDGDFDSFIQSFDEYKETALGFPSDRHSAFLSSNDIGSIKTQERSQKDDVSVTEITIPVIGGTIPGLIVEPTHSANKGPVIVCPGHPEGNDPLNDLVDPRSYQKGIAVELAKEGHTVFCMGLRGFNTSSLTSSEFNAIASMKGYSWYGFLTSDAILFRRHIVEQFEHEKSKIGYIGLSTGGAVSMFASALDDDIPYALVCGFFGSFSYNFLKESHSLSGRIASILRYFEMRDYLLGTNADQVHVINGKEDTFSADHAREQFGIVQSGSVANDAEYHFHSPKIGHEYDGELIRSILKHY